jgi:superkiller protein 3
MSACGARDERCYELALRYKERGEYDKAIEELQRAVEINPRFVEAHNQLGILYGKVALYEKAVQECRRATELDPSFASAYYNLGVLYQEHLQNPVEAIIAYKSYIHLRPKGQKTEAVEKIVKMLSRLPQVQAALTEDERAIAERARDRAAQGAYEDAVPLYEAAIKKAPRSSADLHLELAGILDEKLNRPEEALNHYQAYLDANLKAEDAPTVMGRVGELRKMIHAKAPAEEEHSPAALEKADALIAANDLSGAIELLNQIRSSSSDDTDVHVRLAEAYRKSGDLKSAEKEYEWLEEKLPEFPYGKQLVNVYCVLADEDLRAGAFESAERRLRRALELSPDDASLHLRLAQALAGRGRFDDAMAEAAAGKTAADKDGYRDTLVEIHLQYGRSLVQAGDYEAAIKVFKEAKRMKPEIDLATDMGNLCEARARQDEERGSFAQAEKEYSKALQLTPGKWRIYGELGRIYEKMGRYDKALGAYEKVVQSANERDRASALKAIAKIYETYKADDARAIAYYERYLRSFPKAPDRDAVQKKLHAAEKEKEKIVEYERAAQRSPENATTHYNLAVLLQRQGKLKEAIEAYQKALALEPHNAQAYFNLGYSYERLKMYDRAIEAYNRAIAAKPNYVKAYNNLAAVYKEKGRYGKAIAAFNKALQLDPTYAHAHLGLGAIYADELKDIRKARYHYKRYIELQPNGPYAPQVRAWLRG